jgi:hypothetical protein
LVELIGRLTVAKKSKKTKRGVPTRKKKGMKKGINKAKKKTVVKKPEPRPAPITLAPAPLLGSFGGKAEDR